MVHIWLHILHIYAPFMVAYVYSFTCNIYATYMQTYIWRICAIYGCPYNIFAWAMYPSEFTKCFSSTVYEFTFRRETCAGAYSIAWHRARCLRADQSDTDVALDVSVTCNRHWIFFYWDKLIKRCYNFARWQAKKNFFCVGLCSRTAIFISV